MSTLGDINIERTTVGITATLWLVVALFVATRGYILFELEPQMSDIGEVYFAYAARAIDAGQSPYQGNFEIEYPPLAWWTMVAPRLVEGGRIADAHDLRQIFNSYRFMFRCLMLGCDVASLVLLWLIARQRGHGWALWAIITYTLVTAILGHLLYDRLDTGLLLLVMLWAWCWTQSLNDARHSIAWSTAAYAALGLGISFKLVPIVATPFLLLAEWHVPRRGIRLTLAIVTLAATAGLPFVVQYAVSGPGVFEMFRYHGLRGIQIESLYSTLMMIAVLFGPQITVDHAHGAHELAGPLAATMKGASTIALIGLLSAAGLWAVMRGSHYDRRTAYRLACYVMATAVILANVLSPQYFIWALPLVLLVALEILPESIGPSLILAATLVAVAALTTWICPYHYLRTPIDPHGLVPPPGGAVGPSLMAGVVLGLRNATYLGVVIWVGVLLFRRGATQSDAKRNNAARGRNRAS